MLAEGTTSRIPIADAARAILDGHIVLNRQLADSGHYPAIDIEQSISRVMTNLIDAGQLERVRRFRSSTSRHQRARDLLAVGAYAAWLDPLLDRAIANPRLEGFLQQGIGERADYASARRLAERLRTVVCHGVRHKMSAASDVTADGNAPSRSSPCSTFPNCRLDEATRQLGQLISGEQEACATPRHADPISRGVPGALRRRRAGQVWRRSEW